MALGGLGAVLLSGYPLLSFADIFSKVDLRSVFLAVVTTIIVLVLAYLTNPSETSFRAYLTELSFKQHLTRLDDNSQDDAESSDESGLHFTPSRQSHPAAHKSRDSFDTTSPFHFVSRASVSLRTPKHVFYSFGILTIAAVYPTGRSRTIDSEHVGSLVSDAWYIGAYGRWWRGGVIQSWWHEVLANTKDAERCGSGILDLKALDVLEGLDGLAFPAPSRLPSGNPAKRNAERKSAHGVTRSTTPPPLPKSASLPLHAPKVSATPPKISASQSQRHPPPPPQTITPEQPRPPVLAYPPSSPSLWDSSPIIAEVLRQIAQSKTAVLELRTQLTDFHTSASESHATIQSDLDAHRERKREDDAARAELKARTKTLEDSKRSADSSKRDAEKRLREAESARENAAARIERLEEEIGALRNHIRDDEDAVTICKEEGDVKEEETQEALDKKKKEIQIAEEVVAALTSRAKEWEERIAQEEERLRRAIEEAELKKQDRSFYPLNVVSIASDGDKDIVPPSWSSLPDQTPDLIQGQLTRRNVEASECQESFPLQARKSQGSSSSGGSGDPRNVSASPRPARLSLTGISNLREPTHLPEPDNKGQVLLRLRGVSGDLPSSLSTHSTSTRFSPFGDADGVLTQDAASADTSSMLSPTGASYIPSSLISSLDGAGNDNFGLARSFQSDDDAVLARDWRKNTPFFCPLPVESPGIGSGMYQTSPMSVTCPSFESVDKEDPFEVRPPPLPRRSTSNAMDYQHATFPPAQTMSDPPLLTVLPGAPEAESQDRTGTGLAHRRWSSQQASGKERKGLNPEAKAFSLNKRSFPSLYSDAQSQASSIDSHGFGTYSSTDTLPSLTGTLSMHSSMSIPSMPSSLTHHGEDQDSLFSSISMRAFAPSLAEREALQRALGGSTNTSLERLPTLSEVSSVSGMPSIPPSPPRAHAQAAPPGFVPRAGLFNTRVHKAAGLDVMGTGAGFGLGGGRTLLGPSLSWLQSFPHVRKPKFSPWEDEETKELKAGGRGL